MLDKYENLKTKVELKILNLAASKPWVLASLPLASAGIGFIAGAILF